MANSTQKITDDCRPSRDELEFILSQMRDAFKFLNMDYLSTRLGLLIDESTARAEQVDNQLAAQARDIAALKLENKALHESMKKAREAFRQAMKKPANSAPDSKAEKNDTQEKKV